MHDLENNFPVCWGYFTASMVDRLVALTAESLPDKLQSFVEKDDCPAFLPDLARVELAVRRIQSLEVIKQVPEEKIRVNSALELVEVSWAPLLTLFTEDQSVPYAEKQFLLFWRRPQSGDFCQAVASNADLLALKVVVEGLEPVAVAKESGCPVGDVDRALEQAVRKGLLLQPESALCRQPEDFSFPPETPKKYLQAGAFTLQWHITHRCDLHCQHCYDRSRRDDISLSKGLDVLDQMRQFCLAHHVYGQVSFSGGNPFLHPDFFTLYRGAHERNLNLAILGNPVSETALDRLLKIARPVFFQVSLEGLQEHNDSIRGAGSFASVFAFLELLQKKNVYSMVMLTLTQANLDQVLPLAESLRNKVDLFTYNRLSMVGEGANLESPRPHDYRVFVREYLQAQQKNPAMALKDSLINIEREKQQLGSFGGCTGFGCGAAFNFVSLLPDGQVHACRKFPSPIGDINQQDLHGIYYSSPAQAYRRGCKECEECRLRATCGGCLAVAHGYGLDPLTMKDPACFVDVERRG